MSEGLALSGLVQRYGEETILNGIDLTISPGEFVALLGRSGSGKTTLLRLLCGLETPTAGTVTVPHPTAVVFQEPRLLPWKSTWENVVLGIPGAPRDRAVAALAEVGLAKRVDAWPLTLSGGEAQRAALARALVREPRALLLDEPFAALDALTRIRMHALVDALWRRYRPSVLLVTHDVDEAIMLADRILVLENGRIVRDVNVVLSRPRNASYSGFYDLRRELLATLGVDAYADVPPEAILGNV
jgi:sulfonate transport system ATP-binding protein